MKLKSGVRLGVLLGLLLLVLAYAWKQRPATGIAPAGGEVMEIRLEKIPLFLQRDSRWGSQRIGGSNETVAAVGCTLASASMGLAHFGVDLPPDRLNAALKTGGGYTPEGWLIWHKLGDASQNRVRVSIPAQPSHELIDQALRLGRPVIANVLFDETFLHWVLITGKAGRDYLIHDPLGSGREEKLSKFKSGVYAIRILEPV